MRIENLKVNKYGEIIGKWTSVPDDDNIFSEVEISLKFNIPKKIYDDLVRIHGIDADTQLLNLLKNEASARFSDYKIIDVTYQIIEIDGLIL